MVDSQSALGFAGRQADLTDGRGLLITKIIKTVNLKQKDVAELVERRHEVSDYGHYLRLADGVRRL
jgi:hypothetical protein